MLIYTHDNPDPDSLAAAMSLERLLEHELGARVTLTHGGIVGRAQNRAMVDTLKLPLVPAERVEPDDFDVIAIVDSQPETGNNSLPPGHRIDIVVDHHPPRAGSARAPWCDIRPDLGATSTIIFEYLRARTVPLDASLATAVFFALRTETRDLGRESTEAERRAYLELVPLVDHAMLYRMTHPKVPREHFAALDRALRSAQVFGDLVAVNLGDARLPRSRGRDRRPPAVVRGRPLRPLRRASTTAARTCRCAPRPPTRAPAASCARSSAPTAPPAATARWRARACSRPCCTEQELQKTFLTMVERLRDVLGHEAVPGTPLLRAAGTAQREDAERPAARPARPLSRAHAGASPIDGADRPRHSADSSRGAENGSRSFGCGSQAGPGSSSR